jgi:NhaA family Na+:H+ antiporter
MTRAARFAENYLVVPLGAILAMIWANSAPESYFSFALSSSFLVNSVGMALFFAFVTQEIRETMTPGGALATWRHRVLPIVAAVGGLLGSVLLYFAYLRFVDEVMLSQAWPCAGAVDIVFSYFLARMIFKDRSGVAFTLLLALTTDIVVLVAVAIRDPFADFHPAGPLLIVLAVSLALIFRWKGLRTFWPYLLICGPLSWWGFFWSGLQPALALIPIIPFVLHAPRNLDLFTDTSKGVHGSATHLERVLMHPVQVVLFFFALVNSGVQITYFEAGTWALPLAALIGRPAGVAIAVSLAVAAGCRVPHRHGWRDLAVAGLIVSTGFSFALFLATGILPTGNLLTQTKVGALSTVVGSVLALVAASMLHVGRFKTPGRPHPAAG